MNQIESGVLGVKGHMSTGKGNEVPQGMGEQGDKSLQKSHVEASQAKDALLNCALEKHDPLKAATPEIQKAGQKDLEKLMAMDLTPMVTETLDRIGKFMYSKDPELGTSWLERMQERAPHLYASFMSDLNDSEAGKMIAANYSSGEIDPSLDNPMSRSELMRKLQA